MKRGTPAATGKYGALIQKAKGEADQKTRKPENQLSGLTDEKSAEVNLSIKVPRQWRRHWVSEARRQDTTLTAVIIALLKEKFGEPDEL